MDFLSLVRRGDLSGSDSPDGFVGNNHIVPVGNLVLDGSHLSSDNFHGLSGFSFFQEFTNAENNLKAVVQSDLGLVSDDFITFTVQRSSLTVTQDDVVETVVLDSQGGNFTSESTIAGQRGILSADMDIFVSQIVLNIAQMQSSGGNNDIDLSRVKSQLVDGTIQQFLDGGESSVGFPVSTDKVSSQSVHDDDVKLVYVC
mmetsp:Transcript_28117/g.32241  ORF Transcript_28117/g.32241 Transcript_28117/m.32241 type:complete len:200 (+) Transcript_28117:483-1082(+)